MKLFLAVLVIGVGMTAYSSRGDEAKDASQTFTGVLIDNACGANKADESAAANHSPKCCLKESCAASGYQLIVGDKHYKLDDKGNEQAKTYLKDAETTRVTVEGKVEGDKLQVSSIHSAKAEKKD